MNRLETNCRNRWYLSMLFGVYAGIISSIYMPLFALSLRRVWLGFVHPHSQPCFLGGWLPFLLIHVFGIGDTSTQLALVERVPAHNEAGSQQRGGPKLGGGHHGNMISSAESAFLKRYSRMHVYPYIHLQIIYIYMYLYIYIYRVCKHGHDIHEMRARWNLNV